MTSIDNREIKEDWIINLINKSLLLLLEYGNHLEFDHTWFPTMEAVARFVHELLRHDVVNVNCQESHESLNKYIPKCASSLEVLCLFFLILVF